MIQKRSIILIFSLIVLTGCTGFQKYLPKLKYDPKIQKQTNVRTIDPAIRVLIDSNYYSNFECSLKLQIIKSYLNKFNYKNINYFKIKKEDIKKKINIKYYIIFIHDDNDIDDMDTGKLFKSLPMFSPAAYFLTHPRDAKFYKNINNINNAGLIFESETYYFARINYGLDGDISYYSESSNLLRDFMDEKFKLLIIDRNSYYQHILELPVVTVNTQNFGTPYGYIYFTDITLKNEFDYYLGSHSAKGRYEWSDVVYQDPDKNKILHYIAEFLKKF
jgi:hypothetical protein